VSDLFLFRYRPGDTGYTFSRSGTATYHDANGRVQIAATGVLRDAHYIDGVRTTLIELNKTNRATFSEDATDAVRTKTGVTVSANVSGPDGNATADQLVEDGSTGRHELSRDYTLSNLSVAYSVYLKPNGRDWVALRTIGNDGVTNTSYINLATGDIVGAAAHTGTVNIRLVRNLYLGFCRLEVVASTPAGGGTTITVSIGGATGSSAGSESYTGDGASGFIWWGEQLETSQPHCSTYIPATGAGTVTRNIEDLTFPHSLIPQAMTPYVDFFEIGTLASGSNTGFLFAAGSTTDGGPFFVVSGTTGKVIIAQHNNGTTTRTITETVVPNLGDRVRFALQLYSDGGIASEQAINGGAPHLIAKSAVNALGNQWNSSAVSIGGRPAGNKATTAIVEILIPAGVLTIAQIQEVKNQQVIEPLADVAVGDWTNEAGAVTGLYGSVDEDPANDADYVQSPASVAFVAASHQGVTPAVALDYNADYTVCGWVKFNQLLATGTVLMLFGVDQQNTDTVYLSASLPRLVIFEIDNGVTTINGAGGAATLQLGVWYFVALVRSGNVLRLYRGTPASIAQDGSAAGTGSPGTRTQAATGLRMGSNQVLTESESAEHGGWRAYTRALTAAELQLEAGESLANSLASLWADWPLSNKDRLVDRSGNGRDLSALNGPLTTGAAPPYTPSRAARFTRAASQYLTLASAPDYNAAYTVCGWVRPTVVNITNQTVIGIQLDANNFDWIRLQQAQLILRVQVPGASTDTGVANLVAGQWAFVAAVRASATSIQLYVGTSPATLAATDIANTRDVSARSAATAMQLGNVISGANLWGGDLAGWRVFTRALSLTELQAEAAAPRAVSLTSLWADWPLKDKDTLADRTGNARNLAVTNGPLTTSDAPPPYTTDQATLKLSLASPGLIDATLPWALVLRHQKV
jgi:hypothetical protein